MKAVILKCQPGFQFHFGEYAPDTDTALNKSGLFMRSDTLFSALVRTYDDIFKNTDDFVKQFENGNILISSVYFCIDKGDELIWFLPKPVSYDLIKTDNHKSLSKINFISKKLWETIVNREELIQSPDIRILQEKFAIHKDELSALSDKQISKIRLYLNQTTPKVLVHSPTKEDNLYQLDRIEIADNDIEVNKVKYPLNIHYYFLYKGNETFEKEFGKNFRTVIEILVKSGIGGERSTIGNLDGADIIENWQIKDYLGNYFASTSLLLPEAEDIPDIVNYKTIFRGGRRTGDNTGGYSILKTVRLMSEGAILSKDVQGKVIDISPDSSTNVYKRNGKSLNLSIPESWINKK